MKLSVISRAFVNVIGSLPDLSELRFTLSPTTRPAGNWIAAVVCPFASLVSLQLRMTLVDIEAFTSSGASAPNLKKLKVDITESHSDSDLADFMESLVQAHFGLTELVIYRNEGVFPMGGVEEHGSLTSLTLGWLARLPLLETFDLRHTLPVDVSDTELVDILSRCTSLKSLHLLHLRPRKSSRYRTALTLGVLALLAQQFPALGALSMSVGSTVDLPETLLPFTKLSRLSLGLTFVEMPESVALYLRELLPDFCLVDSEWENVGDAQVLFSQDYAVFRDDGMVGRYLSKGRANWALVKGSLPILARQRADLLKAIAKDGKHHVNAVDIKEQDQAIAMTEAQKSHFKRN